MQTKYLIIGVNAAGFHAIEALRKYDPIGSIVAVNGESCSPYKRTKINKNFKTKLDISKFQLSDFSWYEDNNITLLNSTRVLKIDINSKEAVLNTGLTVEWEFLLLSTGAASFNPPQQVFNKAVTIRSYSDALIVEELIKNNKNCLVYGLGIEGIETAAQLFEAGLKVTIAGRGDYILERYFSSHITSFIEALFSKRGIPILYNTDIDRIQSIDSGKGFLTKSVNPVSVEGYNHIYDFMLHSIGIKPNIDLAVAGGIKADNGIIINSKMETSAPSVYAAGDCTQIETGTITDHWHSAQDQGRTAAANMAGSYLEWPSKRYRVKVEIFGKFFFSMRPFLDRDNGSWAKEESILSDGAYRLFFYKNNTLRGLEMAGDKARAKLYEKAVNEEWSRERVTESLA